MYYNPVHPHCGPFNSVSKKRPRDAVDAACWEHDRAYGKAGPGAYFSFNGADRKFIDDMDRLPGFAPRLYAGAFRLKRFFSSKMYLKRKLSDSELVAYRPNKFRGNQIAGANAAWDSVPSSPKIKSPFRYPMKSQFSRRVSKYGRKVAFRKGRKKVVRRKAYRKKAVRPVRRVRRVARKVRSRRRGFVRGGRRPNNRAFYTSNGSSVKVERGGVIEDPECVYIGAASIPFKYLKEGVGRAIVKNLFKQMGQPITSWEDTIKCANGEFDLKYTYFLGNNDPTVNAGTTIGLASGDTYDDLALDIIQTWATDWSSATTHLIDEIWIESTVNVSSIVQRRATVRGADFMVHVDSFVHLRIQNTTLARVTDDNGDLSTDIENNPLVGKLYVGRFTGFQPKWRQGSLANWGTGFYADPATGLILAESADVGVTQVRKPPPGSYFKNCSSSYSANIMPGQVKSFSLKFKRTFFLNNLISKYNDQWLSMDLNDMVYIGNSCMYGLEKMIDSRQGSASVRLSYELNHNVKVAGTYRVNQNTVPLIRRIS